METGDVEPTEDQRGFTAGGQVFNRGTKPHDSIGQERETDVFVPSKGRSHRYSSNT